MQKCVGDGGGKDEGRRQRGRSLLAASLPRKDNRVGESASPSRLLLNQSIIGFRSLKKERFRLQFRTFENKGEEGKKREKEVRSRGLAPVGTLRESLLTCSIRATR